MNELTTPEAAALLGVQPKTVSKYIKRGILKAERHGRDYFIAESEMERFKTERRGRGRPKLDPASVEAYAASPRRPGRKKKEHV